LTVAGTEGEKAFSKTGRNTYGKTTNRIRNVDRSIATTNRFAVRVSHGESDPYPVPVRVSTTTCREWTNRGERASTRIMAVTARKPTASQ
jgi:hypothetical protein